MDDDRIEPAGNQANESVIGSTALHKVTRRAKFFRKQSERLFELASECPEHHLRDQLFALANEYVGLADAPGQAITEPERRPQRRGGATALESPT